MPAGKVDARDEKPEPYLPGIRRPALFIEPRTAGAHFGVSKSGEIWQYIDTVNIAYGAGAANDHGVHLENVGVWGDLLTRQQIESNVKLVDLARADAGMVPFARDSTS